MPGPCIRAENAARRTLRDHWPAAAAPVKVREFAKRLGVEVAERADLEFRGVKAVAMLIRAEYRSVCVVNKDLSSTCRRFAIAHELGHFVLHPYREHYVDPCEDPDDRRESEASAFASALLMPQELLARELPLSAVDPEDEKRIEALARAYQVPIVAMTIRLAALGLLTFRA